MSQGQSFKSEQKLRALESHPQYSAALEIVKKLSQMGYETVFAGGCVRDALMGQSPKDLDLATAAPPGVVESAFARTLAVGKAFGTIVILSDEHNFEVTTFRQDGPYSDGRHPEHVHFRSRVEDAQRRDFTVNAMFYDPLEGQVLDQVGGLQDLELGLLRTVGAAHARFAEDRLRMLRAIRFVAQLGFKLDGEALKAIQSEHKALRVVSAERIFNEMRRLLMSKHLVAGLALLLKSKLHLTVWPEISGLEPLEDRKDLEGRQGQKILKQLPFLNWEHAYAGISLTAGAELRVAERLRAWKAPRESLRRVEEQLKGCRLLLDNKTSIPERMRVFGREVLPEILLLVQGQLSANDGRLMGWITDFLKIASPRGELPNPLLTGQDLIAEGVVPGKQMGEILKAVYDQQLEGRLTTREQALSYFKTEFH